MRPLRCKRCRGVCVTEPDAGGLLIEIKCLECGRTMGEYTAESDVRGISPTETFRHYVASQAQVDLARSGIYPLWVTND